MPSPTPALGVVGAANLGPLCSTDFKVSVKVETVCEEVAHFVALSYMGELFRSMPLQGMFRSIEVNAAKVRLNVHFLFVCFSFFKWHASCRP